MKMGKKTTALLAAAVGALVFTTTALADVAIGSGYNSLKDAAKTTMAKLTREVDNFTAGMDMALTVDGKTIATAESTAKYDMAGGKKESVDKSLEPSGDEYEYYFYEDAEKYVSKGQGDDKYYVNERIPDSESSPSRQDLLENPFEDEFAADAEAVVDAFVGNLKDIVQVEESEGKKMYIANLPETQVPTLVNALTSFGFKYSMMNDLERETDIPAITNDIFVKGASAKAIQNEDGIIESVVATGSLAGKDAGGVEHTFALDISLDLSNINNTEVVTPEFNESNAVFNSVIDTSKFSENYVGTYKNNIMEGGYSDFQKVGERVLEITSVVDGVMTGRYYETYTDGTVPEDSMAFDFVAEPAKEGRMCVFTINDKDGQPIDCIIQAAGMYGENLYISLNVTLNENGYGYSYNSSRNDYTGFNEEFIRIFE